MSKKRSRAVLEAESTLVEISRSTSTEPGPVLASTIAAFVPTIIDKPEIFIETNTSIAESILKTTKALYDMGQQWRPQDADLSSALSELVTDGLDDEQIWEELQLQNEPMLSHMEDLVERLAENDEDVTLDDLLARFAPKKKRAKLNKENDENGSNEESEEETDVDEMDIDEEEGEDEDSLAEKSFEFDSDEEGVREKDDSADFFIDGEEDGDGEGDEGEDDDSEIELFRTRQKKQPVTEGADLPPDPYYDEDDLEDFIEQAELEEQGIDTLKVDSDDEERALALLYGGEDSEEEGGDDDEGGSEDGTGFKGLDADAMDPTEMALERALDKFEGETKSKGKKGKKGHEEKEFDAKTAKYSDWFAPLKHEVDEAEKELRDEFEGDLDTKSLKKQLSRYEREQERMRKEIEKGQKLNLLEDDGEDFDDEFAAKEAKLSQYEKKAEQLRKKIQRLEEENLSDKSWQMLGEATATRRPANSLLEEDLEFDFAARPTPVVTEAVTKSIEDMIKYRIFHEAFDDPIQRQVEDDKGDYRERAAELDGTKSKKSLAEIYEEEYQQKVQGVEKDDPKAELKDEIARLFKAIVFKLDALANAQTAPRKTKEELSIRTLKPNVSAITMEEVTPIAVSDASRLAPEEISEKPKTNPKGETEYTREDRKKARKEKKETKKKAKLAREEEKKQKERRALALMSEEEKRKKAEKEEGKAKGSVEKAIKELKDSGAKNINFAVGVDSTQYSKSTALFEKLQSEAQREAQSMREKKGKGDGSASKKGPGNEVLKYRL